MAVSLEAKVNQNDGIRQIPKHPPNIWKDGNAFTSHFDPHSLMKYDQRYGRQMEELKLEVKELLIAPIDDVIEKVKLIDLLCRLDISYHFQNEIQVELSCIFESHDKFLDRNEYDLFTISLLFRILRQHGYKMSSGYFDKFKNRDDKFQEYLSSDAIGMLSLYEATFLQVYEEDILVEALTFTKHHLPFLAQTSSPSLAKQINNALELPLHKSMPRLEAVKFISLYEQEESKNESLLLLAKLDFNRVQLFHQKELNHLLNWRKDLNLPRKLAYVRDRIIEAYLWAVMTYSEPCYSRARVMLTKMTVLFTMIDDTHDSYATYDESVILTDAIQRWDIKAMDDLPDYLQIVYHTLLDKFNEIMSELTVNERSYRASFMKNAMKKMFGAYLVEAEWVHRKHVPTIEDYMKTALVSIGCTGYATATFLGVDEEIADINVFEWVESQSKILKAAYEIARFKDDISSHVRGEDRDHVLCSVECFMKEGLSREEIIDKYDDIILVNIWRDLNDEFMKTSPVSKEVLKPFINMGRLMEVTFKDGDGHTYPEKVKDIVSMLFIDELHV